MIVTPMLGDWEVPRIESIRTLESRRIATLGVPGLLGDLQQDLGTDSLVVEICGSLHGDQARDDALGALREKFRAGEPVDFVADIVTATELEQVLIPCASRWRPARRRSRGRGPRKRPRPSRRAT